MASDEVLSDVLRWFTYIISKLSAVSAHEELEVFSLTDMSCNVTDTVFQQLVSDLFCSSLLLPCVGFSFLARQRPRLANIRHNTCDIRPWSQYFSVA